MTTFDDLELQELHLFDANCQLGSSDLTVTNAPTSALQLVGEMDRCGIAESLVCHSWAAGCSPREGNSILMAEISGLPRLHGVWVIVPPHTGEMERPDILVKQILANQVRAVRMFPLRHRFLLSEWSVNEILERLNEHRLPLFLDFDRNHWAEDVVDYCSVRRMSEDFPDLPIVLVREGIGSLRYLYPLLERCDNLYIETSYYQTASGLEDISKRFGSKHLLFGSGLPSYEAGPAISMLIHADISEQQRRMVAGDNLRMLVSAVRS